MLMLGVLPARCSQTAALLNGTDFNGDNVTDFALCIDAHDGERAQGGPTVPAGLCLERARRLTVLVCGRGKVGSGHAHAQTDVHFHDPGPLLK